MSRTGGRGDLGRFAGLVAVLSLPFWVLGAAVRPDDLPLELPASALMAVCPAVAAALLSSQGTRRPVAPVDEADWPRWWWLVALGMMPAVLTLSYVVARRSGQSLPTLELRPLPLVAMCVVFGLGGLVEELGWTRFATPRALDLWGEFGAGLAIGVVWAIWHIVPYAQAGRDAEWIVWQCAATVALRVILVWLFVRTGGNLAIAVAFHASINVSSALYPVDGSFYDPMITGVIVLVVAGVLATTSALSAGRSGSGSLWPPVVRRS